MKYIITFIKASPAVELQSQPPTLAFNHIPLRGKNWQIWPMTFPTKYFASEQNRKLSLKLNNFLLNQGLLDLASSKNQA